MAANPYEETSRPRALGRGRIWAAVVAAAAQGTPHASQLIVWDV